MSVGGTVRLLSVALVLLVPQLVAADTALLTYDEVLLLGPDLLGVSVSTGVADVATAKWYPGAQGNYIIAAGEQVRFAIDYGGVVGVPQACANEFRVEAYKDGVLYETVDYCGGGSKWQVYGGPGGYRFHVVGELGATSYDLLIFRLS